MFKTIKKIKINYKQYGAGDDIILLHGWGQNIQMMEPISNYLKASHKITIVDLPGFGMSSEPDNPWTVYDYAEMLHDLFQELNIINPILIGHSFGGRLAIVYASKYPTRKVVLFGSPCVRHEYYSKKTVLLKKMKKIPVLRSLANFMKKYIGSADYKQASPMMRDILVKTINEDLSKCAKKITCPCLLIWGDKDTAVPLNEAHELDDLLKDSALIILPGTHYCYLENLGQIINILNNFI